MCVSECTHNNIEKRTYTLGPTEQGKFLVYIFRRTTLLMQMSGGVHTLFTST